MLKFVCNFVYISMIHHNLASQVHYCKAYQQGIVNFTKFAVVRKGLATSTLISMLI